MDERRIIEALAAEIETATAAGDHDRTQKLADLLDRVVARIGHETAAEASGDVIGAPLPGIKLLARIARRISTEALAAELGAERGDWEAIHQSYGRLAVLFAEYRLAYVQGSSES